MRRKAHKNSNERSAGKVITGMLLGSVLGATVGWLTAPTSGQEMRRKLRGEGMRAREKAKTAIGNVESKARELVTEVNESVEEVKAPAPRRQKVTTPTTS